LAVCAPKVGEQCALLTGPLTVLVCKCPLLPFILVKFYCCFFQSVLSFSVSCLSPNHIIWGSKLLPSALVMFPCCVTQNAVSHSVLSFSCYCPPITSFEIQNLGSAPINNIGFSIGMAMTETHIRQKWCKHVFVFSITQKSPAYVAQKRSNFDSLKNQIHRCFRLCIKMSWKGTYLKPTTQTCD